VCSGTQNSWYPPIPGCIVKASETVVAWPGWMVVGPTTASGGQQPAAALTCGTCDRRSGRSPTLVSVKVTRAGVSNRW